jgi:hypothetical protein
MADWFWVQPVATIAGSAMAVTAAWRVGARQLAIAAAVSDTAALSLQEKIFERRLAAFFEVMQELRGVLHEEPDPSLMPRVHRGLWLERFLFTPAVYEHISTGYEYAEALRAAAAMCANCQGRLFTDDQVNAFRDEANRARDRLEGHLLQLADMAMPDLALHTWKSA